MNRFESQNTRLIPSPPAADEHIRPDPLPSKSLFQAHEAEGLGHLHNGDSVVPNNPSGTNPTNRDIAPAYPLALGKLSRRPFRDGRSPLDEKAAYAPFAFP